jgi:predicted ferric reductase
MATILVISFGIVQRHFYEIFRKLHLALAAIVVAGVWVHASPRVLSVPQAIYMMTAICVWAVTHIVRFIYILYRNVKYGRPQDAARKNNPILGKKLTDRRKRRSLMISRAKTIAMPDGVQVHVKMAQPWEFRAGQYVYLRLRAASRSTLLQSHPFVLSWWYKNKDGDDIAVFMIKPRKGFTQRVEDIAPKPMEGWKALAIALAKRGEELVLGSYDTAESKELMAIIEGPYGNELNLESYDTVLLFATGIGIAAQLPYIRLLLQQHYTWVGTKRRIALFWEVDSECR